MPSVYTHLINNPYTTKFFAEGDLGDQVRVAQMLRFARETAGIDPKWCWQELAPFLKEDEMKLVREIRQLIKKGSRGFVYQEPYSPFNELSVHERMNLIAGTCVRNDLDARVRLVDDLVDNEVSPGTKDCPVLLIPDLCTGSMDFHPGARRKIRSLLLDRGSRERYTIVFVTSLVELEASFGLVLVDHIKSSMAEDPR